MAKERDNKLKPSVRPSVANTRRPGAGDDGANTLFTRRQLLYGAAGVGAVAAIAAAGTAISISRNDASGEVAYLDAPASALSTLGDLEALDSFENSVRLVNEFDLPYGSLIWANDEEVAACLLPTETGSPLAQAGLVFLGSGVVETVLEKARSAEGGFEIYDVRANANGIIWTEANILQGTWRIYLATIDGVRTGDVRLAEEGSDAYDTPTIAVSGGRAFWLVNAKATENASEMPSSRLMGAAFGAGDPQVVFESKRRMGTPPYGTADSVVIAPRIDSRSLYYQLTCLNATTGEVRDTLTLPHAVTPIEAGYGPTGFMFSFPDIYDYDGAIANLGTYAPVEQPADGNYNAARWFDFTRTPTAPPAWCAGLLIVKSSYSVCGVDLAAGTYFAIDVDDGADSYGEYLASTGEHDTFVTYTNIDHTPVGAEKVHACRVKIWTALT